MPETAEQTFYLCWSPGQAEVVRCAVFEAAKTAALSLAKRRGCSVYVMKSVGILVPDEPKVSWLETKE